MAKKIGFADITRRETNGQIDSTAGIIQINSHSLKTKMGPLILEANQLEAV